MIHAIDVQYVRFKLKQANERVEWRKEKSIRGLAIRLHFLSDISG